jgi:hypothetical protein
VSFVGAPMVQLDANQLIVLQFHVMMHKFQTANVVPCVHSTVFPMEQYTKKDTNGNHHLVKVVSVTTVQLGALKKHVCQ